MNATSKNIFAVDKSNLFRFMQSFKIDRFQFVETLPHRIIARVGWPDDGSPNYDEDEELQDISWKVQRFPNFEDALKLCEYLQDNKLIDIDKISVSEEQLFERLGWKKNRLSEAIETLLEVHVDMLDDGKETDFFFLHF